MKILIRRKSKIPENGGLRNHPNRGLAMHHLLMRSLKASSVNRGQLGINTSQARAEHLHPDFRNSPTINVLLRFDIIINSVISELVGYFIAPWQVALSWIGYVMKKSKQSQTQWHLILSSLILTHFLLARVHDLLCSKLLPSHHSLASRLHKATFILRGL